MSDTYFEQLLVCSTCGTQYEQPADEPLAVCKICIDPRQYVPPGGQQWTSLAAMRGDHHNTIEQVAANIWSLRTEPKIGIGQRCFFIQTPAGNVLWDCITYLDEETTAFISVKGGLAAILVSHPHFYSTHAYWAEIFNCPVYIAAEDEQWCSIPCKSRRLIQGNSERILPEIEAIKLGGHFPGSMVLHYAGSDGTHLFHADTMMLAPSALTPEPRAPGTSSFSFQWSYPNQIPLAPDELARMWTILKSYSFEHTHGGFAGQDLSHPQVKARVLESMQLQVRYMGWTEDNAAVLRESLIS